MKRIASIALAVTFLLGAGAAAQAAPLAGELGILDVSGNNPATGAPWTLGDSYRFAFFTSASHDALSTDIATYNDWVQGLADASTAYDISAADGATWKVIGSTSAVDARDNTLTNPDVQGSGHAILLLDGSTVVANDFDDLWDGDVDHIIDLMEDGTTGTHWPFTGTASDGTAATQFGPLGTPLNGNVSQGQSGSTTNWIWRTWTGSGASSELQMYAMSDELNVVPEPATLALLGLGGLGTLIARRKRR